MNTRTRYFHPFYHGLFVNENGIPYKIYKGKVFTVLVKGNVSFYYNKEWRKIEPERFAWECFNGKVIDANKDQVILVNQAFINAKKYSRDNLRLVPIVAEDGTVIKHPLYKYGICTKMDEDNKEVIEIYSYYIHNYIKHGKLFSMYDHTINKKVHYNFDIFVYECKRQRLLSPTEFLIKNKIYNSTKDRFIIVNDEIFERTNDREVYINDMRDKAFYTPWCKVINVIDGFINVGSKDSLDVRVINI